MSKRVLKIARIGNSRGVRLPADSLERYRIGETVVMEERSDGILLRPNGPGYEKLTWDETARQMAGAGENWTEWDSALGDGLEAVPWNQGLTVAEPAAGSRSKRRPRKR